MHFRAATPEALHGKHVTVVGDGADALDAACAVALLNEGQGVRLAPAALCGASLLDGARHRALRAALQPHYTLPRPGLVDRALRAPTKRRFWAVVKEKAKTLVGRSEAGSNATLSVDGSKGPTVSTAAASAVSLPAGAPEDASSVVVLAPSPADPRVMPFLDGKLREALMEAGEEAADDVSSGGGGLPHQKTRGSALVLYRGMVHPAAPGLVLLGLQSHATSDPRVGELQVRWALAFVLGALPLPPAAAMRSDLSRQRSWRRAALASPLMSTHGSLARAHERHYMAQLEADLAASVVHRALVPCGELDEELPMAADDAGRPSGTHTPRKVGKEPKALAPARQSEGGAAASWSSGLQAVKQALRGLASGSRHGSNRLHRLRSGGGGGRGRGSGSGGCRNDSGSSGGFSGNQGPHPLASGPQHAPGGGFDKVSSGHHTPRMLLVRRASTGGAMALGRGGSPAASSSQLPVLPPSRLHARGSGAAGDSPSQADAEYTAGYTGLYDTGTGTGTGATVGVPYPYIIIGGASVDNTHLLTSGNLAGAAGGAARASAGDHGRSSASGHFARLSTSQRAARRSSQGTAGFVLTGPGPFLDTSDRDLMAAGSPPEAASSSSIPLLHKAAWTLQSAPLATLPAGASGPLPLWKQQQQHRPLQVGCPDEDPTAEPHTTTLEPPARAHHHLPGSGAPTPALLTPRTARHSPSSRAASPSTDYEDRDHGNAASPPGFQSESLLAIRLPAHTGISGARTSRFRSLARRQTASRLGMSLPEDVEPRTSAPGGAHRQQGGASPAAAFDAGADDGRSSALGVMASQLAALRAHLHSPDSNPFPDVLGPSSTPTPAVSAAATAAAAGAAGERGLVRAQAAGPRAEADGAGAGLFLSGRGGGTGRKSIISRMARANSLADLPCVEHDHAAAAATAHRSHQHPQLPLGLSSDAPSRALAEGGPGLAGGRFASGPVSADNQLELETTRLSVTGTVPEDVPVVFLNAQDGHTRSVREVLSGAGGVGGGAGEGCRAPDGFLSAPLMKLARALQGGGGGGGGGGGARGGSSGASPSPLGPPQQRAGWASRGSSGVLPPPLPPPPTDGVLTELLPPPADMGMPPSPRAAAEERRGRRPVRSRYSLGHLGALTALGAPESSAHGAATANSSVGVAEDGRSSRTSNYSRSESVLSAAGTSQARGRCISRAQSSACATATGGVEAPSDAPSPVAGAAAGNGGGNSGGNGGGGASLAAATESVLGTVFGSRWRGAASRSSGAGAGRHVSRLSLLSQAADAAAVPYRKMASSLSAAPADTPEASAGPASAVSTRSKHDCACAAALVTSAGRETPSPLAVAQTRHRPAPCVGTPGEPLRPQHPLGSGIDSYEDWQSYLQPHRPQSPALRPVACAGGAEIVTPAAALPVAPPLSLRSLADAEARARAQLMASPGPCSPALMVRRASEAKQERAVQDVSTWLREALQSNRGVDVDVLSD
ncbi:hypothetical protein GPECTOR_156g88 [Gonium pectorale]|uniref:Uncharacterized protein n=1 Tax=Gonium pectorale TaxID=33097 RepID=A0A150FXL1_GONPE|nr:hypothetical protein GPECTOR_156g88 [Gonium pectorale]|eukprot:KXZ42364.1 hypothetical protein GPECTOR_156g88 [Gonium pectorale]